MGKEPYPAPSDESERITSAFQGNLQKGIYSPCHHAKTNFCHKKEDVLAGINGQRRDRTDDLGVISTTL